MPDQKETAKSQNQKVTMRALQPLVVVEGKTKKRLKQGETIQVTRETAEAYIKPHTGFFDFSGEQPYSTKAKHKHQRAEIVEG